MKSIFVIRTESGDYDDYIVTNIFAVEDRALADTLCDILNKVSEAERTFRRDKLQTLINEYHAANPAPTVTLSPKFGENPRLPFSLKYIAKPNRSGSMYESCLVDKAEHDTRLLAFRKANMERENLERIKYQKWEELYQAAFKKFEKTFDISEFVPEEFRSILEPYLSGAKSDSYLVEEIDLISSADEAILEEVSV